MSTGQAVVYGHGQHALQQIDLCTIEIEDRSGAVGPGARRT